LPALAAPSEAIVIVVHVEAQIDPAKEEQARSAALVMQEATRAEPGNVAYRFAQAVDDPATVLVIEVWQDQDGIDAHNASDHMAEFMAVLGGVLAGPVQIWQFEAGEPTTFSL
jgi:quinol monooxygenase YgiN